MPIQLALFDLSIYTVELVREPPLMKEKVIQSDAGESEQLELPLIQPQNDQRQLTILAA